MKKENAASYDFETQAIHAGVEPCPVTGATNPAIYQSSAYAFKSAEHAANIFSLKEAGFLYSRVTNPTVAKLEERIAALEGGVGATCTPSGLAAHMLIFSALMSPGDHFIASRKIYGGTTSQFRDTFKRAFGWQCHFIDPTDPALFEKALAENDKIKLIFIESLSNPEGVMTDIEAIAKIADKAGIPLIVDNTIPSPYLCRPLEHGASIVTHSTTKYISGHGHAMGGVVVDGGTFDWIKHADKYPALGQPDKSYHDNIFADMFPENPLHMHNHAVGLRDLGLNQQPMNAYLTMVGMDTLALRMRRHSENALKVASFLEGHDKISWVNYAGLPSSPYHKLAQKYLREGMASSLFTFGVKGGYNAAVKVVENVDVFTHVANIGDTHSLIIHPASTTHSELMEDEKIKAGALPEAIRVSVGIENADDLIADLDQALNQAEALAA